MVADRIPKTGKPKNKFEKSGVFLAPNNCGATNHEFTTIHHKLTTVYHHKNTQESQNPL
jgi:hypothetical protein